MGTCAVARYLLSPVAVLKALLVSQFRMTFSRQMPSRQPCNVFQKGQAPASLDTSKLGAIVWLTLDLAISLQIVPYARRENGQVLAMSLSASFDDTPLSKLDFELLLSARSESALTSLRNRAWSWKSFASLFEQIMNWRFGPKKMLLHLSQF